MQKYFFLMSSIYLENWIKSFVRKIGFHPNTEKEDIKSIKNHLICQI